MITAISRTVDPAELLSVLTESGKIGVG